MHVRLEQLPNVPEYVAIMRGPVLLSCRMGTEGLDGLVADDSRWGHIAHGDKNFFVVPGEKRFDKEKIVAFCRAQGIALYDTAEEVIRLKGNASDDFLQVERPTDLSALLEQLPECRTIVATGQKSAETLQAITGCAPLPVGGSVETDFAGRHLTVWRMPSSSRAYPRPVEWKSTFYQKVLESL